MEIKGCRTLIVHLLMLPVTVLGLLSSDQIPIGIFLDSSNKFGNVLNESLNVIANDPWAEFTLVPYTRQIDVDSFYNYKTQVCDVYNEGVFVTLAAENSTVEYSIMSLMERLHMPFITFSDQDLLDNSWQYKIRMTPSYIGVLADLERFYHWEHVFYLYDDDAGLARFERFYEIMNAGKDTIEIDLRYLKPSLENSYEVLRYLDSKYTQINKKQFNEKVLILDLSSDWMTQTILDQLVDLGMARENYHIIPATLSINNLNLDRLHYGGVTITGFQLKGLDDQDDIKKQLAMDGITLISKAIQGINDRRTLFTYRRGVMYNGDLIGISCHTPDNPLIIGPTLMSALKETQFKGLTGLVKFDDLGYRVDHTFDIYQQIQSNNLTKVGNWTKRIGLSTNDEIRAAKNVTRYETGFYNETFIVTTVLVQPYAMLKGGDNLPDSEKYEGYAIDLARKLSEIIGFNFTIAPVKDHGSIGPDGNWSGMVGELIAGRADMAIADLTITSARERVVDFSTPFMNLGISIMIQKPEKQKPSVFSFMEPLSNKVWMCIAFSFTGISIVIYVVSRVSPNEWKVEEGPDGEETVENEFTAQNSAWFVAGALMCQGSELSPIAPSNRVVGSAWWLFTLIIISSYTANLAAFLTVENINIPVKNVQELHDIWPEIKYGTLNSGTTRAFFENSTSKIFQEMWANMASEPDALLVEDADAGIAKVRASKGKFAFLFESTTNEFANQRKPCTTMKVGENLDSKNYGVATPRGHKLRHQVTMAILRLHESGELNKLQQTWWYDKGQCSNDDGGSSIKALSLSNVAGVFYILIGGLLIAMFCALLEFIVKSVQDAKKYKKSFRESMKSKARLSIAGESDDSPYFYLPRPSYRMSVDPPPPS